MKKTAEMMKKGGNPADPEEVAKLMGGNAGGFGAQEGAGLGTMPAMPGMGLGMGQPGYSPFGGFTFPNMANQQAPSSSQQSQGQSFSQQAPGLFSSQQIIENSFFERTYAAQLL
jgi:hypothetical protein